MGSIGTNNGLDHFIDAAIKLENHEDIHFIIVGEGDLKEKYQKQTQSLNNFSIIPKVPKTNVQDLLSYCDLAYFSTVNVENWHSGQSLNKVIDYMYAAKPILATFSGYPSMLNESKCGEFIPHKGSIKIEDKILEYFRKTKPELEKIGKNGKEWLLENRKYSYLAKKYILLIDSL